MQRLTAIDASEINTIQFKNMDGHQLTMRLDQAKEWVTRERIATSGSMTRIDLDAFANLVDSLLHLHSDRTPWVRFILSEGDQQ